MSRKCWRSGPLRACWKRLAKDDDVEMTDLTLSDRPRMSSGDKNSSSWLSMNCWAIAAACRVSDPIEYPDSSVELKARRDAIADSLE